MKLANKARGAVWRSRWSEGLGATGDAKERPCSEHRVGKPLVGLDAGPERSGTAVPEGCRHNRSEEPDALARTSGSGRGPSGNRRATATVLSGLALAAIGFFTEPFFPLGDWRWLVIAASREAPERHVYTLGPTTPPTGPREYKRSEIESSTNILVRIRNLYGHWPKLTQRRG